MHQDSRAFGSNDPKILSLSLTLGKPKASRKEVIDPGSTFIGQRGLNGRKCLQEVGARSKGRASK